MSALPKTIEMSIGPTQLHERSDRIERLSNVPDKPASKIWDGAKSEIEIKPTLVELKYFTLRKSMPRNREITDKLF